MGADAACTHARDGTCADRKTHKPRRTEGEGGDGADGDGDGEARESHRCIPSRAYIDATTPRVMQAALRRGRWDQSMCRQTV